MFKIYTLNTNETVFFAAHELRKYLRMMMPECGDIRIEYDPQATDGFRLGLMQQLSLDVSDAENSQKHYNISRFLLCGFLVIRLTE